ncbi:MAG: phenylalanine--tRNA ligase subunit beta [Desulfobulbaceae bacterium]|nr:phenylalanine--tRNA ligase subunit beta [Desulfobulbaceae bacterium]HIJ89662.1 phenylalanine--tRNA ligase subunit beta [Deltaproteobacteria bacterium]
MKFTFNWLREYIDTDLEPVRIADHLTMLGLEVDACVPCYPDLTGVVVARIEAVQPHPNADKLVLCDVNVGHERKRVVCGAPNARAGLVTALALPGAVLPAGFTIKPAKIRGEESCGMLCSAKELGITEEQVGIMELSPDLEPGQLLSQALGLVDTMIEVDLTPNRPDCASVLGIAREVGGVIGKRIKPPLQIAEPLPLLTGENLPFSVEVESSTDCPRYAARLVKNVKIASSPWWLQQRLLAVGMRPINNIVDITNFVMLEYGQPLHAFDFNKLAGGRIVVRRARAGESLATLDGAEHQLDSEMLMICDAERPVAVAGIMGGANSEVDGGTCDILLESACFSAIGIRRTAGRLNMSTESSYRFERGVDPQGVPKAMERAVQLMAALGSGEIVAGGFDYSAGVVAPVPIILRRNRTCSLLGMDLTLEQIAAALTCIEIDVERIDDDTLRVTPPSFRVDLEREVDLIEEVARIVGYNLLPTTLPMVPMSFSEQDALRELRKKVADTLTALGFYEAINYSFVSPQHGDLLGLAEEDIRRQTVHLLNPLAEDQSVLRTTLLPGLLENLRRNVNHQSYDVRLFEVGKVFHPQGSRQPEEPFRLAAVISGRRNPGAPILHAGETPADLLDVTGIVAQIFDRLQLGKTITCQAGVATQELPFAEPGTVLAVMGGGKILGWCGAFSQKTLKGFGVKQEAFFVDIDLAALAGISPQSKTFAPLPKFPFVKWDMALIVPEGVAAGEMLSAIDECGEKLIEKAEIFDVFQGKNIETGKKSVAISITYRASDRTLDDETVGKVHKKNIEMMISRFNGQLREA